MKRLIFMGFLTLAALSGAADVNQNDETMKFPDCMAKYSDTQMCRELIILNERVPAAVADGSATITEPATQGAPQATEEN